jgi:hypothetical protein
MALSVKPFKLVSTDGLQRIVDAQPDISLSRNADPLKVCDLHFPTA